MTGSVSISSGEIEEGISYGPSQKDLGHNLVEQKLEVAVQDREQDKERRKGQIRPCSENGQKAYQ